MMVIMALVKNTIRNILDYIKYSNLIIDLKLNPYSWRFGFEYLGPDEWNPHSRTVIIRLLMFKVMLFLDDAQAYISERTCIALRRGGKA